MTGKKVPIPVKIGYGIGTAGDSVPYNLFFTYFLFFLTDVAGANPAVAGIISFVAVMWDAVTDPAVGFLSDNSRNPNGRRRPWIFKSIWPLAIVTFLLFMPNEFAGVAQSVYYILMAVLLWTFYTTYTVPYAALGAEITRDYNERNTIRMIVGLCAYPFVTLCNSGPMWIIAALAPQGISIKVCWGIAGAAAVVASGTDFPIVPDLNPMKGMQIGMTRTVPKDHPHYEQYKGVISGPEDEPEVECLSLTEMIESYSWSGAYQMFVEDITGTIEPGKSADIVVLAADIAQTDPMDIGEIKVDTVIFQGEKVKG